MFVNIVVTFQDYNKHKSEESKTAFYTNSQGARGLTRLFICERKIIMKNHNANQSQTLYHYNIELVTLSDVKEFVGIAATVSGTLRLTSGDDFSVNAKSFLGVMLAKRLNWEKLTLVSDHECYHEFSKFITM